MERHRRMDILLENVEKERVAMHLTQKQMAQKLDMSLSGYKKMIAGETAKEQIIFKLHKADGTTLTSTTSVIYEPNAVNGTIEAPIVLEFEEVNINVGEPELSLYPNPAKAFVEVTVTGLNADEADVVITNAAGAAVFENGNAMVIDGTLKLNITLDGLATGNYMVTVSVNGVQYTAKFIKL